MAQSFENAINEKDYIWLKVDVINKIKNNPSFSNKEADRAIAILQNRCPEIFETYQTLKIEDETKRNQPEKWDRDYFMWCAYYLELNFCIERVEILRKVGRKISGGTQTESKTMSEKQRNTYMQQQKKDEGKQGQNPTITTPERRYRLLAVAIATVVVLVLLTVLVLNLK